jgi:hypothetical protein
MEITYRGCRWDLITPKEVEPLAEHLDCPEIQELLGLDAKDAISRRLKGVHSKDAFAAGLIDDDDKMQGYAALIRYRGSKGDLQGSIFFHPQVWGHGAFKSATGLLWQASLLLGQQVVISINQENEQALEMHQHEWGEAQFEPVDEWWYPRLSWVAAPESPPRSFEEFDAKQLETLFLWLQASLSDNYWRASLRTD